MKENQYNNEISRINHNIQYYQNMLNLNTDSYQRVYYKKLLDNEIKRLELWEHYYRGAYGDYMQVQPTPPYSVSDRNDYVQFIDAQTETQAQPQAQAETQARSQSGVMESMAPDQKEFTLEELAKYNGSGGQPAYVAVDGTVYDVSREATWGGGTHFGLYAGKDMTPQFKGCHGGRIEVLKNLPKVGILKG